VSSLLSLLSATTTTTTRSERSERKSGESFDLEGVKGGRELGDGGAGFFGEEEEDAEADEDESMGVRWGWNSLGAEDYRVFGVGPWIELGWEGLARQGDEEEEGPRGKGRAREEGI
jgi:hypothetical protein